MENSTDETNSDPKTTAGFTDADDLGICQCQIVYFPLISVLTTYT